MLALGWKCCVLAWIDVLIILGAALYKVELREPFFWTAVVTSFVGSLVALIAGAYEKSEALCGWSLGAFAILAVYLDPDLIGPYP